MTQYDQCDIKENIKEDVDSLDEQEDISNIEFFSEIPDEKNSKESVDHIAMKIEAEAFKRIIESISKFKIKNLKEDIEACQSSFDSLITELKKIVLEFSGNDHEYRYQIYDSMYHILKKEDFLFPLLNISIQKCEDEEENLCEVEIRTNPTLEEIKERTEGFTLFERVPGLLFRNHYEDENFDKLLNSPVVCRVRYLLRDLKEEMEMTTEKIIPTTELKKCLDKAYQEYRPQISTESQFYSYSYDKIDFKSNYINYKIDLNVENLAWVRMDLRLRNNCILTGSI